MARLSFVLVLSLLASSVLSLPTHGIRPRHKACPTGAIKPTTSPSVAPESTTGPAYGKGTAKVQAVDDTPSTKSSTKTTTKSVKPTTSTSESDPEPTDDQRAPGAPSGGNGRVAALTPVSGFKNAVSFADVYPGGKPLSELPVTRQAKTSKFTAGTFQGRKALRTLMTKGSIAPGSGIAGGMSFYSPAPELQASGKTHYLFSYSVYFEKGFAFNKGGKLPGLFGGSNLDVAGQCSGGKHPADCFSMRLMWRNGGAGELYAYIPVPTGATRSYNKNDQKCGRNASGKCSGDYGYSMGTGAWTWTPGQWITVAQRIKLNTIGKADGEAEIFINGKSVLSVDGLVYRTNPAVKAFGRQMQVFFGGHTQEWACPKDQEVLFADMTTAILD